MPEEEVGRREIGGKVQSAKVGQPATAVQTDQEYPPRLNLLTQDAGRGGYSVGFGRARRHGPNTRTLLTGHEALWAVPSGCVGATLSHVEQVSGCLVLTGRQGEAGQRWRCQPSMQRELVVYRVAVVFADLPASLGGATEGSLEEQITKMVAG